MQRFCRAALHSISLGDVKLLQHTRKASWEGGAAFEKMLHIQKLADAHLNANESVERDATIQ